MQADLDVHEPLHRQLWEAAAEHMKRFGFRLDVCELIEGITDA